MYGGYVKKEDVRDVPNGQRVASAIISLGVGVLFGVMQFAVYPKLIELYKELGADLARSAQHFPLLSGVIIASSVFSAIYLLSTKPDYSKVDKIARKYKAGEMIKRKELMDTKNEWIPILFLALAVGYLVVGIINPIYKITSQF